jgi:4,5-DOPA dioxygenase extradiol
MPGTLPSLFVSHGAPDILTSAPEAVEAMRGLAADIPRPESILIVSAHWITQPVGLTGGGALQTIHDFSGFTPELYTQQYPAQGDEALSLKTRSLLESTGIEVHLNAERGLDHGAWVPLSIMFPGADIPVVQLSLPAGSLADVARLGEAVAPLRESGVLVIGSGGSVHNPLRLKRSGPPDPWASGFEQWLLESVENGHHEALLDPANSTQHFNLAHPTLEHYSPLLFAWAAGNRTKPGRREYSGFSYGNLGMSCYRFGNE